MRRPLDLDDVAVPFTLTETEIEEDLKELGFSSTQIRAKMKKKVQEPEPEEYAVEQILDVRKRSGRTEREFLVSWVGWSTEFDEWISESDLCGDPNTFKMAAAVKAKLKKEEEAKKPAKEAAPTPSKTPRRGRRVPSGTPAKSAPPAEQTPRRSQRSAGRKLAATTPAKRALSPEEPPRRSQRASVSQSEKKAEKKKAETKPKPEPKSESEEEYIVEKLLDVRKGKKGKEFLVSWAGYESKDDQWVVEKDLMAGAAEFPMAKKVKDFLAAEGNGAPSSTPVTRRRKRAEAKASDSETPDEDKEYEVLELVDVKTVSKIRWFQVRWKNYDDLTWETEDCLTCDLSVYNLSADVLAKIGTSAKRPKREHRA